MKYFRLLGFVLRVQICHLYFQINTLISIVMQSFFFLNTTELFRFETLDNLVNFVFDKWFLFMPALQPNVVGLVGVREQNKFPYLLI